MKGLGDRIRELRKTRRLTLVQVADKTGIDQATLSRIENEVMTGTLKSHLKIAEVLGVPLPSLYEGAIRAQTSEKERAAKHKFETFFHSTGAVAELLTTGILQKKMVPMLIKLKAKGHTSTEEFPAGSERFLYVLNWAVELFRGKERQLLKAGESLYFNADKPHHFRNAAGVECRLLSMLTPASL